MYEFKWLNYHYRLFTHPRYTIRSVTETFAINYSIICCDMWHLIFVIAYVLDVKFSPNGKYFPHTFWVEKIDNAIFWCVVPGYTRLLGNEAQVCTSEKAIMTFAKLMSYVLWCIWVYPASLGLEADIIFQQLFFICIFLSFFFSFNKTFFCAAIFFAGLLVSFSLPCDWKHHFYPFFVFFNMAYSRFPFTLTIIYTLSTRYWHRAKSRSKRERVRSANLILSSI